MLRGERVTLRSITREDLPRLWRFGNDLEVEISGGGDPPVPRSLERVQADFEREARDGALEGGRGKTEFAIEADGECIGRCGLYGINETNRHCELGIVIGDTDYWGRGYGREAVGLLIGYAFRLRNLTRVWLEVHAGNERAIRAYTACGFVEEGRMREHIWLNGHYVDNVLMGVLRKEWVTARGG